MFKVLTDGKTQIGAYKFSDRKKIALCKRTGDKALVYGWFNSETLANMFMEDLGKLVNALEIGSGEELEKELMKEGNGNND